MANKGLIFNFSDENIKEKKRKKMFKNLDNAQKRACITCFILKSFRRSWFLFFCFLDNFGIDIAFLSSIGRSY